MFFVTNSFNVTVFLKPNSSFCNLIMAIVICVCLSVYLYFFYFCPTVPLNSVTLSPNNTITYPIYNVASIYSCITSMCKPAAIIHWFEDNVNITNMSTYAYNNYVATSLMSYIPKTHGRKKLSCIANQVYEHTNLTMHTETTQYVQCK